MNREEAQDYIARFEVECGLASGPVKHIEALRLMLPAIDEEDLMEVFTDQVKRVHRITKRQDPDPERLIAAAAANGLLYGAIIGVGMERARVGVEVGDDELAFLESIEPEEDPSEP